MQFSFTRFYHLFIKQWKENKKAYILGLVSLPIVMGVVFLSFAYSSNLSKNVQDLIFAFGLVILGGIFCATLLSAYSPKPKGIRTLILPISVLEKLLVAVAYGLIIFPILYLLLVYPVLVFVNYIDTEVLGNLNLLTDINTKGCLIILSSAIIIYSFVLLCSVFFRKFIFIKAALAFVTCIFILFVTNSLISKVLIGNSQPIKFKKELLSTFNINEKEAKKINFELADSGPFSSLTFNAGPYGSPYVSANVLYGITTLVFVASMLLIACFYRLKEIEL